MPKCAGCGADIQELEQGYCPSCRDDAETTRDDAEVAGMENSSNQRIMNVVTIEIVIILLVISYIYKIIWIPVAALITIALAMAEILGS